MELLKRKYKFFRTNFNSCVTLVLIHIYITLFFKIAILELSMKISLLGPLNLCRFFQIQSDEQFWKCPNSVKCLHIWTWSDIFMFVSTRFPFSHKPSHPFAANIDAQLMPTISPLHTIRCCLQTMTKLLFRKKIEFYETWWKEVNTIFVIENSFCRRPQLSQMCVATENTMKKVLWIRQKTAYCRKRILQNTICVS